MPCFDPGERRIDYQDLQKLVDNSKELALTRAVLCAVFTYAEATEQLDALFSALDYEKADVPQVEVEVWWANHKAKDK